MPREYEAIRDKLRKTGMDPKAAKKKAARIFNSRHPEAPVGPGRDAMMKPPRRRRG